MKILHISTFYNKGGAAIAAKRLHKGLLKIGVDSYFYSYYKPNIRSILKNDFSQLMPNKLKSAKIIFENQLKLFLYNKYQKYGQYSTNYLLSYSLTKKMLDKFDIINLHWINSGFINIKELKKLKDKKVFWTLHDMWTFTGGCHYNEGCEKFTKTCSSCPILNSKKYCDHAYYQFELKKNIYEELDLEIVTPSKWLYDEAKRSTLFKNKKIHLIPYGLDTDIFYPQDKNQLRTELGIQQNKFTIIFNSANIFEKRKGILYLMKSLQKLSEIIDFQVILVGNANDELKNELKNQKIYYIGSISSESLIAKYYALSDVFVIPSLQDNLPNTMLEAIACGTPVIGFNVGGIADAVIDDYTGNLVKLGEIDELVNKIRFFSDMDNLIFEKYRSNCRNFAVERYSLQVQANSYNKIYQQV